MIIKEYRVVMPVSVEEYQVAQLYMVAKLSAQQTGIFVTFQRRFIISVVLPRLLIMNIL